MQRYQSATKHITFDSGLKNYFVGIILWYIFILCLLIQVYFILNVFAPLLKKIRRPGRLPLPVSVIICAKNELENLKRNLAVVLEQKHPVFEVILMDDHSSDGTFQFVKELQKKYKHLKYFKASDSIKNKEGKKAALAEAISKTSFEKILLTDADCRPSSLSWIEIISAHFTSKNEIVLGIGQYTPVGNWHDNLIQYETIITAFTYLGFALKNKAYMGVGRNLAYSKAIFKPEYFAKDNLASGDDDLLIQKATKPNNTTICVETKAQTFSESPSSYKKWISQKQRHFSTAFSYKPYIKISLVLLKLSFYTPNFIVLLFLALNYHTALVISIAAIRWLFWLIIFSRLKEKLGFTHRIYLLPWYEFYFCLFDIWITTINLKKKKIAWK